MLQILSDRSRSPRDLLITRQKWVDEVSGDGTDSGRHLAEQAPVELRGALTSFLAQASRQGNGYRRWFALFEGADCDRAGRSAGGSATDTESRCGKTSLPEGLIDHSLITFGSSSALACLLLQA